MSLVGTSGILLFLNREGHQLRRVLAPLFDFRVDTDAPGGRVCLTLKLVIVFK